MAFRIQDPSSKLFWEVDGGNRIRLGDKGSVYTHDSATGFIVNVDTGMNVNIPGKVVMEGGWPTVWVIEDGVISVDAEHIIRHDEDLLYLRVTSDPASWVLVPVAAPVAVPEPVAAPVAVPEPVAAPVAVPEAEPESEEDTSIVEPEVEEDEDVPVARAAALIEEALNAQAATAAESEEEA
jgi:hypothetical protein